MRKPHAFRPVRWDLLEDRVVLSGAAVPSLNTSAATTPTQLPDAYAVQAHAANVALADSGGASGIVFFGDSIIHRWDAPGYPGPPVWNAALAPLGAVDFGVEGDRTQNLLWQLQNGELDGKPKVAVVEIGTDNLVFSNQDESPSETAAGIATVVETIRAVSPGTKVLLLGLLPRSQVPSDPVRGEIQQVNSLISGMADGNNVRYLDLGALFLRPDGTIPAALMQSDAYLHPTTTGYQLMADALQAPLHELLGQPDPAPTSYGGPVLVDVPANQVIQAPGPHGAELVFAPPLAFDALDPNPVIASNPPLGTMLPVGTTVVNCTATDRYGHVASASFTVQVTPAPLPVLHNVPSNLVAEATSPFGAVVNFALPTATDVADPAVNVSALPPSGSTFPIGTTLVTINAVDKAGNVARATFQVTVHDTTPPAFAPAPNLVVEATGPDGAVVNYTPPTATDLVDPDPSVTYSPPSGSLFPIGTTVVNGTARDRTGNVSSTSFLVTVRDTPVLHNPPPSMVVEATSTAGAVVNYTPPTATDTSDSGLRVVSSPPSGSTFPLGTTVVTSYARGISGVATSVSFTVTVVPHANVGTVPALAQAAVAQVNAAVGGAPPHLRSRRRGLALSQRQISPTPGNVDPAEADFLRLVDTNHDGQVSRREMIAFLSANVDLNHNGKVSLYEQASYQLRDPQWGRFVFPGS